MTAMPVGVHPLHDGFATRGKSGVASKPAGGFLVYCTGAWRRAGSARELIGGLAKNHEGEKLRQQHSMLTGLATTDRSGSANFACLSREASRIMQSFVTLSHILVSLLAHDIGTAKAYS